MRRDGHTPAGKQRWRCRSCGQLAVRTRRDTTLRYQSRQFVHWLTGNRSLAEMAGELGCSRQALAARFAPWWSERPQPSPSLSKSCSTLILDGVYLSGRVNAVLIARSPERVHSWSFAERENTDSWMSFLFPLPPPLFVVADGQKGLTEAVSSCFPNAQLQRCLVHAERYARMKLSRNPKTRAGRELWALVRSLWQVRTRRQRRRWVRSYRKWERRHEQFLKQRSSSPTSRGWWYTHRNVRSARTHIRNALPHLFLFVRYPEVPRTTNHVEGGVNARLKELVRRHRGLSPERKRVLAAHYLSGRSQKKTT